MKINKSEDCDKCRGCCKFEKGDEYFSPIFTIEEINKIRKSIKNIPKFNKHKNSKNVFQIELVKSKKENLSVCPFLDEDTHLCNIYELRPFDCKLWPFVLTKTKDGKSITLSCFDKDLCPPFEKSKDKHFEEHKKEVIKLIKSKTNLIRTHPELVWENEEDTFFVAKVI